MNKKVSLLIFTILLSLSFIFGGNQNSVLAASKKFDCTYANISCKGVDFTSYGTASAYSDYIYALKGQQISYNVTTDGDSQFHLIAYVRNSSGQRVTPNIWGVNTVYFDAPYTGNYRIYAYCSDTGSISERCKGQATISE
ncbi:hypothetical protein LJA00_08555 [Campylobacter jejuni]